MSKIVTIISDYSYALKYMTYKLAGQGYRVNIYLISDKYSIRFANELKCYGVTDQINIIHGNIKQYLLITSLLKVSDYVLNLFNNLGEKELCIQASSVFNYCQKYSVKKCISVVSIEQKRYLDSHKEVAIGDVIYIGKILSRESNIIKFYNLFSDSFLYFLPKSAKSIEINLTDVEYLYEVITSLIIDVKHKKEIVAINERVNHSYLISKITTSQANKTRKVVYIPMFISEVLYKIMNLFKIDFLNLLSVQFKSYQKIDDVKVLKHINVDKILEKAIKYDNCPRYLKDIV